MFLGNFEKTFANGEDFFHAEPLVYIGVFIRSGYSQKDSRWFANSWYMTWRGNIRFTAAGHSERWIRLAISLRIDSIYDEMGKKKKMTRD